MSHPFSVVTLTHNKRACTERCLMSFLDTAGTPWELVVVDNGSTDGTPEWLERFRAVAAQRDVPVTVIRNRTNAGCSTARNQGLAAATGECIAFVDNDVALRSRNWLARLGAALSEEANAAAVGPKLVYPFAPYPVQCAGVAISRSGRVRFVGRGEPRDAPGLNARREAQALISACVLFRRRVLEEIGGFDEAFNPVEYEDLDLCYRARSRGYGLLYEPAVEMYHFESVTTAGTPSLPNTSLIIRHGLLFKSRWRRMFENEAGPPDAETAWQQFRTPDLSEIGELPVAE